LGCCADRLADRLDICIDWYGNCSSSSTGVDGKMENKRRRGKTGIRDTYSIGLEKGT